LKTNAVSISPLPCKDLLSVAELDAPAVEGLFRTASAVKKDVGAFAGALAGKTVILIFEKPSLRTRVSFEAGVARLGGHPIYYDHSTSKLGERESVHDYARNLERMVDLIVCRTHAHGPLAELAGYARIGVVNALCEKYHPCQALADLFTMRERLGDVAGRRLVFVGDGNNVCHSLVLLATTLGMRVTVVGPKGYEPDADVMELAAARARKAGGSLALTTSITGVKGADVVYTDTWVSMGDEPEQIRRREAFQKYQVDGEVMARAAKGASFMHCLPANRGMEVTDEVIDSPASVVFDQAENRMHAQNALMLHLLVPGFVLGGGAADRSGAAERDRSASGGLPSPVVRTSRRRTTVLVTP
jgi:ornithine carbamoyltransferase